MTKMDMAKTLKKVLLWNRLAKVIESHWNLVYSIGHSNTTKLVQMMILGWPLTFLYHGQLWFFMPLYGKKLKWWITQNHWSLWVKLCICGKLNDYMEICMYQMSRTFFDLCARSLRLMLSPWSHRIDWSQITFWAFMRQGDPNLLKQLRSHDYIW